MKLKNKVFLFIGFLFSFILIDRFIGFPAARGDLYSIENESWEDIYHNLWLIITISLLFTFFGQKVYKFGKEQEKRDMDAARKRIEERERKEKEESQEKDDKESDVSE